MKINTIKIGIYITGLIGLFAFIGIRFQGMTNLVLKEKVIPEYWENTLYGELYYFNFISHFKEKNLPPSAPKYRRSSRHPALEQADILTFGDSFFDFTRIRTFPEILGDSLNKRVFYERFDYPLEYLSKNNYQDRRPKILLYETAERYIPTRFQSPHETNYIPDHRSRIRIKLAGIRDLIFLSDDEARYTLILTRSYFSNAVYSMISTFKFDVFGYISKNTPAYALDRDKPWLFYYEEVNDEVTSFYYQHPQEQIDTYCDNIARLAADLKQTYHLELVFMPVPSKYTIYHKYLNNDPYNDFLPMIYEGLEKRGIPVIKLLDDFRQAREELYYGTDTHWNDKGILIAVENTMQIIQPCLKTNYIAADSLKTCENIK